MTEGWKVSYLRKTDTGFGFMGVTADPKVANPVFGIEATGDRLHGERVRDRTWERFPWLRRGTAVQLCVELTDLLPGDPQDSTVIIGRTQRITAVSVPNLCRKPNDRTHTAGADLCLRVRGDRVMPSCPEHAGDEHVTLNELSELLGVPVCSVDVPENTAR